MTRLSAIRKRLEAATPSAYLNNKWPFTMIGRDADWDFIEHAPLDVRDLLDVIHELRAVVLISEQEVRLSRAREILSRLDAEVEG